MASEIVKDEVRLLIQPTTKKGFLSVQAAVKMIDERREEFVVFDLDCGVTA